MSDHLTRARRLRRDVMTSGEVADVIGVASNTVGKFMKRGLLHGYLVPGSNHRLFRREEVLRFCRAQKVDVPAWFAASDRVLWVGPDPAGPGRGPLAPEGWEVCRRDSIAGGVLEWAAASQPVIVLDFSLGRTCCVDAARVLARHELAPSLIALVNEDTDGGDVGLFFTFVAGDNVAIHDALTKESRR